MHYREYRVDTEHIHKQSYTFDYETVEPTESAYDADDVIYTHSPTCSPVIIQPPTRCPTSGRYPIPIKVPTKVPSSFSNITTPPTVSYHIYYTKDNIIYGINISFGIVFVCIVFLYFHNWYEKNRRKIGKIQHPKYPVIDTNYIEMNTITQEHTNYNSDF